MQKPMQRKELLISVRDEQKSAISNAQVLRCKLLRAGLSYWRSSEANARGIIKAVDDLITSPNVTAKDVINAANMTPMDAMIYMRRTAYPLITKWR